MWTTCLLFYQTLLLAAYGYAHLGRRLGVRRQALLHVALVAAGLALLPITPSEAWRPAGPAAPTAHLLALLAASVVVRNPRVLFGGGVGLRRAVRRLLRARRIVLSAPLSSCPP